MRTPLPAAARRLLASRMVVSVGQGVLAVDFALYARALHWSVAFLGGVVGAGILVSGLLSAAAGPMSDLWGRKPFLLAYQALALAAGLLATFSASRHPVRRRPVHRPLPARRGVPTGSILLYRRVFAAAAGR